MLNIIKMDFYRMFKTTSLYVIWIIMAVVIVLTTYLTKVDFDAAVDAQPESPQISNMTEEDMNLGMSVILPTKASEQVTVYDIMFANIQGKVVGLFIVIFAVIFSMADINSGYIKNIGGQITKRNRLIWSKGISLLAYTVLTMGIFVAVQTISNMIFFGYVKMGDFHMMCKYLAVEVILHFALAIICMTLAMLIRNNVASMIIVICLCMNVMTILYGVINKVIQKIALEDFHILNYTITGKISLMPMELTNKESITAILVSLAFIGVMTFINSVVFEKRDIV